MGAMASQITSLTTVYSTVYSDADQRKHQSSASLAFVRGIHRGPANSPHKWPVTRKMFPFHDVIMMKPILNPGPLDHFNTQSRSLETLGNLTTWRIIAKWIEDQDSKYASSWWRHEMETFSALIVLKVVFDTVKKLVYLVHNMNRCHLCFGCGHMMMAWYGDVFPYKWPVMKICKDYLMFVRTNCWTNSGMAGDLRRHGAHVWFL